MEFDAVKFMLETEQATESSLFSADQVAGYCVTAIFTVINVLVAYLVIKRFIFKPILKMIEKRQQTLESELEAAGKSREEADKAASESKEIIDNARKEAAEIIEQARTNAREQADVITDKAKNDASNIVVRAEEDVVRMKKVALEDMKDDITDLSVRIAQKVIGDALQKQQLEESAKAATDEIIEAEVKKGE